MDGEKGRFVVSGPSACFAEIDPWDQCTSTFPLRFQKNDMLLP